MQRFQNIKIRSRYWLLSASWAFWQPFGPIRVSRETHFVICCCDNAIYTKMEFLSLTWYIITTHIFLIMTNKPNELTQMGLSQPSLRQTGRFGHTPIPSEQNFSLESSSDSLTSSPKDVFGLVLLLGAVQPIWQLQSIFCYRGLWQDDRKKSLTVNSSTCHQNVVLTIATGNSRVIQSLIS